MYSYGQTHQLLKRKWTMKRPAKRWKQSPSALESPSPETAGSVNLFFVPYYFRANKEGNGPMRVSIKRWQRARGSFL
ncbi:hypothetical protein LB506_000008 [Fusarium annulatum]|nr:hypothetical protein LB506_000008 [Fusarium annulatum]